MRFPDKGTGDIEARDPAPFIVRIGLLRDPVGPQDSRSPFRDGIRILHKVETRLLQILVDPGIVDDLAGRIDLRSPVVQPLFDAADGILDPEAEPGVVRHDNGRLFHI